MKQRSALLQIAAIVLVMCVVACHRRHGAGAPPPPPPGEGGGGGRGGGGVGFGHVVTSAIGFFQSGAACDAVKDDTVSARSDNDVVWAVTAQAGCGFDGRAVEIVFTDGDPGHCQCTDTIRNNKARLRLHVKPHSKHEGYTYEIRVAGKTIHPRLEVDP
jgi:hypothetical protein